MGILLPAFPTSSPKYLAFLLLTLHTSSSSYVEPVFFRTGEKRLMTAIMLYEGKTWQDSGILWNTLAYSGILWHPLAYSGIKSHTLVYISILWHTLAHSGILWHTLAYSGILWHTLAYSGLLWHTLAYSG